MVLSMTGYGAGVAQKDDNRVAVEIRTANHRFWDLHIRISREYQFLEGEIQQLIRAALQRGRIEVNVTVQVAGPCVFALNSQLAKGYLEAAERLKEECNFKDSLDLKTLISLSGIVQNRDILQTETAGVLSDLANQCVRAALEGVLQMRRQEGEALRRDILSNLASVREHTQFIREQSLNLPSEYLRKLQDKIARLLPEGGIDPQRLAQEAALLADRCDISEEVARLESHIQQFGIALDAEDRPGKKLDFLLQEMQREANTILAKSSSLQISRRAISLKVDIEKLREQVQNVE